MKKTFLAEEYVAPALEVVSTTVEAGFSLSNGEGSAFSLTGEDDAIEL